LAKLPVLRGTRRTQGGALRSLCSSVHTPQMSDPLCQTAVIMKIEALLDTPSILANQAVPVHLLVRFTRAGAGRDPPRPIAFTAVIDRSGSMAGDPLRAAREAPRSP